MGLPLIPRMILFPEWGASQGRTLACRSPRPGGTGTPGQRPPPPAQRRYPLTRVHVSRAGRQFSVGPYTILHQRRVRSRPIREKLRICRGPHDHYTHTGLRISAGRVGRFDGAKVRYGVAGGRAIVTECTRRVVCRVGIATLESVTGTISARCHRLRYCAIRRA